MKAAARLKQLFDTQMEDDRLFGAVLLFPALGLMSVFTIYPIVLVFINSFYEWNLRHIHDKTFIGLENYIRLAVEPRFHEVVWNTIVFTAGTVGGGMFLALLIALPLSRQDISFRDFFRTAYFVPVITPAVAVSLGWMVIFDANFGILNYMLEGAGLPKQPWLSQPNTAMMSVIIMSVWHGLGISIILFIAGLNAIPRQLYEAAKVDGANPWQSFRSITWPLLLPTTFFVLIISTIGSFQAFDQIYVMTRGGPLRSTTTIVYDLYLNAFEFFHMGYASAQGVVLFFILAIFTITQWKISHEGGGRMF